MDDVCKYCDPTSRYHKDYQMHQCANGNYGVAAELIVDDDGPGIVIFGDGCMAYGYFEVNYCPICGKKVRKDI